MRWRFAICEDNLEFQQRLSAMIRSWVAGKTGNGESIELDLIVFDTTDKLLAVVDAGAFDAYQNTP